MAPDRIPAEVVTDGPQAAARRVLDHAASRPPSFGAGRLVCIDGPAGSGKSTLADRVTSLAPWAEVIHMDDLYEGWHGLATIDHQLSGLVRPLSAGAPGRYRRWDWQAGAWAETVTVPPTDLLVLEGVGSGSRPVADLVTTLVWVQASHDVRMRRGIARDGEDFAPHWRRWAEEEDRHFAAHGTRDRSDLVVDTDPPAGVGVSR